MEAGKVNAERQDQVGRPDRRHGGGRRRQGQRRRRRGDRALGLPDLRLVLGHVHRQFDELPDRGARPVAARQRHGARHPCRPQAPVRRGRPSRSSISRGATTSRTTTSVLPRNIATFKAFENAMTLDIAMGGSTNTVLHLLAAAHEGEVDFTMKDIDRLSRRVPVLCKVAPSVADVHMEDVHRAGGIMAILGELDRAGLHRHRRCRPCMRRRWARRWSAGTSRRTESESGARASTAPRRAACRPRSPSARTAASTSSTSTASTGVHPRRRARLLQGRRPRRALRQPRASTAAS